MCLMATTNDDDEGDDGDDDDDDDGRLTKLAKLQKVARLIGGGAMGARCGASTRGTPT